MSSFPDSIYFAADKTSVGKLVSAHACAMPETSPPPSSTALPCLLFIGKPVLACPLLLASLFAYHVVSHSPPCTLRSRPLLGLPICKS